MEFCAYRSEINLQIKRCHCSNKMVKVPNGCIPIAVCEGCPWAARVMNESMLRKSGENVIAQNPNFKQPGIIEMGTNFVKSTVKHVVNGAETVSQEEHQQRLNICNGCEYKVGNSCKLCGCCLIKKTKWKVSECPIGRWKAVP